MIITERDLNSKTIFYIPLTEIKILFNKKRVKIVILIKIHLIIIITKDFNKNGNKKMKKVNKNKMKKMMKLKNKIKAGITNNQYKTLKQY